MAEKSREQELARAAEELHGATADLREILESVRRGARTEQEEEEIRRAEYRAGLREQPDPKPPFLSGSNDPTLAERFEDELHGSQ